jgi:hypothetical protein
MGSLPCVGRLERGYNVESCRQWLRDEDERSEKKNHVTI